MNYEFKTTKPYQKAGPDVTMLPLDEQAGFLSPIIDFHTREVFAYLVELDVNNMNKFLLSMLKKQHDKSYLRHNHQIRSRIVIPKIPIPRSIEGLSPYSIDKFKWKLLRQFSKRKFLWSNRTIVVVRKGESIVKLWRTHSSDS